MKKETIKDWILNQVKQGSINLEEITNHGCVNGCVSSLIYYEDTVKFHDKFEEEIWELLYNNYIDLGCSSIPDLISTFNGSKNVETLRQFKNLLAWYAVEEISRQILEEEENKKVA